MPAFTIFDCLKEEQKKVFSYPKTYRTHIPRQYWNKGEIYFNLKNQVWLALTGGRFPAKDGNHNKDTHSLYVKDTAKYAVRVFPTSTAKQRDTPYWYIPSGKIEDVPPDIVTKKDVYVLKNLECVLPKNKIPGEDKLYYGGRFEESWMVEIK